MVHFGTNIFEKIEAVNFEWISGAEWYTNALPGSDRPGKWFDDLTALDYDRPFHRSTIGEDHTYFVLDFDIDILAASQKLQADPLFLRDTKINVIIKFIRKWLDENTDYSFFAKLSGSGLHLIQRINETINPKRMMMVTKYLFPMCKHSSEFPKGGTYQGHECDHNCEGWHYPWTFDKQNEIWRPWKTKWSKIVIIDGIKARITIDLQLFYRVHMIRWTYSRNMKIPQRFNYAIPIDVWDHEWVIEHMFREELQVHSYTIPDFQFYDYLIPDEEAYKISFRQKMSGPDTAEWYKIQVPEPSEILNEAQQYMIEKTDTLLTSDETIVPPCVSAWYNQSKTQKGVFWGRLVWIRWLSNKGYSPDQIALITRFKINDDIDNSEDKKHILHEMIPWAYGPKNKPDRPPGCDILRGQRPSGMEVGIATREMCEICTRQYPLQKYQQERTITGKTDIGFKQIQEGFINILSSGISQVIKKATRAGLTTTAVPTANILGKKLLAVVPTNRIGKETFVKAVALSKEKFDVSVNGAMFAANKNACLLLTFLNEQLKRKVDPKTSGYPDWIGSKIAWQSLRYHSKPICQRCSFKDDTFPIPIMRNNTPVPMISSEIIQYSDDKKLRQGTCAYQTLYRHIRDLDVVFITYSKLFALFQTNTDDSKYLQEELFDCFDVLLLDEISFLTNQSALILHVLKSSEALPSDPLAIRIEKYTNNIFADLLQEARELLHYKDNKTTRELEGFVMKFVDQYEYLIDTPPIEQKTEIIKNFLDIDVRIELEFNFSKYHSLIEQIAIEKNMALDAIESLIFLLKEEFWMMNSVPTKFHPIDVTFIAKPATGNIKKFVREFSAHPNKQVLITDATMPYISMIDFFQIPFDEYEIGDPRHTNSSQLVITDSRNVNIIDLFFNEERSPALQDDLLSFIKRVVDAHGANDVMIVAPNIKTEYWLRSQMRDGTIPKCKTTWYRSDLTVGVESKKRTMIMVCPPFPPRGSHDWLAFYFHLDNIKQDMTIHELGDKLAETSAKTAFYQAIGRAKDPEVKERSNIYCWGISGGKSRFDEYGTQTAVDLMIFDDKVPLPNILTPSFKDARSDVIIHIGKLWKEKGILFPSEVLRIASTVKRHGSMTDVDIASSFKLRKTDLNRIMSLHNIQLLKMLGVEVNEEYSSQASSGRIRRFTANEDNG